MNESATYEYSSSGGVEAASASRSSRSRSRVAQARGRWSGKRARLGWLSRCWSRWSRAASTAPQSPDFSTSLSRQICDVPLVVVVPQGVERTRQMQSPACNSD